MALYEYKCPKCYKFATVMKPMAEIDRVETCENCSSEMKRQISRNFFKLDWRPL